MDMVARFSNNKEDRAHCDQFAKKFFVVSQEHEQGVKDIVVELYEIFHEAVEVSKKFEETIFFLKIHLSARDRLPESLYSEAELHEVLENQVEQDDLNCTAQLYLLIAGGFVVIK
jgi:hypothetical protein